mgnify:CR=1 FL=1
MDMYDFVSGGGLIKTEAGYSVLINTILVKSGNTYPMQGLGSYFQNLISMCTHVYFLLFAN